MAQDRVKLTDSKGQTYVSDAVLLTTGYQVFDARRKGGTGLLNL